MGEEMEDLEDMFPRGRSTVTASEEASGGEGKTAREATAAVTTTATATVTGEDGERAVGRGARTLEPEVGRRARRIETRADAAEGEEEEEEEARRRALSAWPDNRD